MSYTIYKDFERALSAYTGAPYVVLTDCCTHALELCLRHKKVKYTMCPQFTYLSVPMMLYKIGVGFEWSNEPWYHEYELSNGIWDSARAFDCDMYRKGQMQCLSFGNSKRLDLKRGGAILLDNAEEYNILSRLRSDGRDLQQSPWQDYSVIQGYHYCPTLETCASGIKLLPTIDQAPEYHTYPDCRLIKFDTV